MYRKYECYLLRRIVFGWPLAIPIPTKIRHCTHESSGSKIYKSIKSNLKKNVFGPYIYLKLTDVFHTMHVCFVCFRRCEFSFTLSCEKSFWIQYGNLTDNLFYLSKWRYLTDIYSHL